MSTTIEESIAFIPGKYYQTRGGEWAYITGTIPADIEINYPVTGVILSSTTHEHAVWARDGRYYIARSSSDSDLVPGYALDKLPEEPVMKECVLRALDGTNGDSLFSAAFDALAEKVHENARAKGFWDHDPSPAEVIARIHGELSETLELYDREEHREISTKIQHYRVEEELADVILRVLDFAASEGLDIGQAILDKHAYNLGRSRLHGKAGIGTSR